MTLGEPACFGKQTANTEEKAHFKSRENGEGATSRVASRTVAFVSEEEPLPGSKRQWTNT